MGPGEGQTQKDKGDIFPASFPLPAMVSTVHPPNLLRVFLIKVPTALRPMCRLNNIGEIPLWGPALLSPAPLLHFWGDGPSFPTGYVGGPSDALSTGRGTEQAFRPESSLPGPWQRLRLPDSPPPPAGGGSAILGEGLGFMIPQCGFFARRCLAARSALQWGLLRNPGGPGAPITSIFFWGQGPRGCLYACVH